MWVTQLKSMWGKKIAWKNNFIILKWFSSREPQQTSKEADLKYLNSKLLFMIKSNVNSNLNSTGKNTENEF